MTTATAPSTSAAPGTPLPPLTDSLLVADWLCAITGSPIATVRERLLAECGLVGHNVREAARKFGLVPFIWNDRLLEFYGQTDSFLYETAVWNATPMKQQMRETVCRALERHVPRGSRVLCYGDGMGFDSAAIAARGYHVTCYEISGPCLDFAQRIFDYNHSDAVIITDESQFAPGSFDAIVCLDVLEHVPDPPAVVRKFAGWLRDDGVLAVHAPFYLIHSTRPTHLKSNRRYAGSIAGLYGSAGFRPIGNGGLLLNPLVLRKPAGGGRLPVPLSLRLGLGASQFVVTAARWLPGVPGFVSSIVCRPTPDWPQRLREAAGGASAAE